MIDWDEAWNELSRQLAPTHQKPEKPKPERIPELTPGDPEKAPTLHPRPLVAKHGQSIFTAIPPHPSRFRG